jgi:Domain of unknown function (DUF4157)
MSVAAFERARRPSLSAPRVVHDVARSPGPPLAPPLRTEMEARLGHDFSKVRVHTDASAAESARAVDAHAYTLGEHIVFDRGKYAPETHEGRWLLTHELVHVAQQRGGSLPASVLVGDRSGAPELEARAAARRAAATGSAGPIGSQPLQVQRENGEETLAEPPHPAPSPAPAPAPGPTGAPAPAPSREMLAIRLDHREAGGFGRFDTLLYKNCDMKVQLRMNFTFRGAWPSESEKRDWQSRYITSVQTAWSRKYPLRATGTCTSGCPTVQPFVQIYAPHSSPHVNIDVTWTTTNITSTAGSGQAHLDSLDLTPTQKHAGVEKMVPGVHEFGHLLGRTDLYRPGGTCAAGYPLQGIMCFGNTVEPADYGPFANALSAMTGCTYTT